MALTRFPIETDRPEIEVTLPVGTHTLKLVVRDNEGFESRPDSVTITVIAVQPPVADAGSSETVRTVGDEVTVKLNASASRAFEGRQIELYLWEKEE